MRSTDETQQERLADTEDEAPQLAVKRRHRSRPSKLSAVQPPHEVKHVIFTGRMKETKTDGSFDFDDVSAFVVPDSPKIEKASKKVV